MVSTPYAITALHWDNSCVARANNENCVNSFPVLRLEGSYATILTFAKENLALVNGHLSTLAINCKGWYKTT